MTILMNELFLSPEQMKQGSKYTEDKYHARYALHGDAGEDEAAIFTHLFDNTPLTKDALVRTNIFVDRLEAQDHWRARVQYEHPSNQKNEEQPDVDAGFTWSIRSSSGSTQRLLFSAEFIGEAVDPNYSEWQAANLTGRLKNIIGWKLSEKGKDAEGIDFPIGGVEIGVKIAVSNSIILGGFLVNVAAHAAQQAVNVNPWNGFAAKTLRFTSYSANVRIGTDPAWDISYTFDFSPQVTVTAGTAPDQLSIVKEGQHYLDTLLEYRKADGNNDFVLPDVIRLATHRIRPEIDYASALRL